MKTLAALGVLGLAFLVGCNQSERGGGSTKSDSFTISGPAAAPNIKQGDTQTVNIKLDRGKDFKRAVTLKADAPKGISADLSDTSVDSADKGEVSLKIGVDKGASVGTHTIRVTGTPENGNATHVDVKVDVKAAS